MPLVLTHILCRIMHALQLHRLESAYPNGVISKACPILTMSSLRRAAYTTLVITLISDSSQHGLSTLPDSIFRETSLPHKTISLTGSDEKRSPTWLDPAWTTARDLLKRHDVTAALLQTFAVRRRVTDAVYADTHDLERRGESSSSIFPQVSAEVEQWFGAVPIGNLDDESLEQHSDEISLFVELHLMRSHIRLILARHRILAEQQIKLDPETADKGRAERVDLAYAVACGLAKASDYEARLGVQCGIIAFVSLEGR